MSSRSTALLTPRRSALSVSLAIGLGMSLSLAAGARTLAELRAAAHTPRAVSFEPANTRGHATIKHSPLPNAQGPRPTPLTHTVDTCADDDSPGSLRAIIASANTGDDDTIDMTQLPMMCSTITLDDSTHVPSHITITQSNLHLIGPGSEQLSINGNFQSSVLRHTGYGTLDIKDLTIAQGKYTSASQPLGGCIYSKGSVTLENSHVDDCVATAATSSVYAAGGGIYAKGDLTLDRSAITSARVYETGPVNFGAKGGGAFIGGNLVTTYSTISDNYAYYGGGASVAGDVISISSSTIHSNRAHSTGGLYFSNPLGTAEIINSTISGNEAIAVGALYAYGGLKLANSTVAFNRDHYGFAGVVVNGASLVLESSIIAGNGGISGPSDLWGNMTTMVSGSNNLIVAAAPGVSPPAGTISDCPQLDLLANNGGSTLTHALQPTSPAIDNGNPGNLVFDQTGYFRVEGIAADIGAFEWHNGTVTERIFVSGFDGLCDQ